MKMLATALLFFAAGAAALAADAPAPATPQAAVDELLAADRAFSAASAKTDVVSGLAPMFAENIHMSMPGAPFAVGREAATAGLRANPENAKSKLEWTPARGGVSADGRHGFTFGHMTLHKPDGTAAPGKYLSYWIKSPEGWRVVAYRRRPAPAGTPTAAMPPALPPAHAAGTTDAETLAEYERSLDAAERSFSDEAQKIGLGPAFAKYGTSDAVNMGGAEDAGFVVGSEAIGKLVSAGGPATGSAVSWAPEKVFVAASGDLGVTIGTIRENEPAAGEAAKSFPFFTVWRRDSPAEPWRYIAE